LKGEILRRMCLFDLMSLLVMALGIIGNSGIALSAELPGQEMIARVNGDIIRRSNYDQADSSSQRNYIRS